MFMMICKIKENNLLYCAVCVWFYFMFKFRSLCYGFYWGVRMSEFYIKSMSFFCMVYMCLGFLILMISFWGLIFLNFMMMVSEYVLCILVFVIIYECMGIYLMWTLSRKCGGLLWFLLGCMGIWILR